MNSTDVMDQIREMVKPLYDTGDLLGFSVCADDGGVVHNESFLSDEAAGNATQIFAGCAQQIADADRTVNRLTVELDDVTLVYGRLEQGHALFSLERGCDLDAAAKVLS